MAVTKTIHVKCKNKLCWYKGILTYIVVPNWVCPKCGFKCLEQYYPHIEKINTQRLGVKNDK
jgi:uncharacterized protein (DUF2225 family)